MDQRQVLACAAMVMGGMFLFQLESVVARKLGMASIWLASGLAAYFFTQSIALAGLMLLAWMFFPLWEMLFVLRKLRVPRHRELADARAPRDDFEEVAEISGVLREAGFEQIDECRLRPVQHEQYYRIFLREDARVTATIGYVAQGAIGFHFIAFTSNGEDGRRWVTWDYPLTYGLVMPPKTAVYRALHCETVEDLYEAHLAFLEANEVGMEELAASDRSAEGARLRLEQTLNQQVEYNISRGFLAPAGGSDQESFCYSWRGTLYVAGQVLRDLLF